MTRVRVWAVGVRIYISWIVSQSNSEPGKDLWNRRSANDGLGFS